MTERSSTCFSDYIVYVDESGDHGLQSMDATYPVFVLAFYDILQQKFIRDAEGNIEGAGIECFP
jgi:hypothetical protein